MLPLVPPTALLFLCDIFILLLYFCTGICIHTVLYDDILINPELTPEMDDIIKRIQASHFQIFLTIEIFKIILFF